MWFFSLFGSKNKKLVKKWQNDHKQIVVLAHKVIADYSKNDHNAAKKNLKALNNLAVDHMLEENIEFYKLLRNENGLDRKTEERIREFIDTFKSTKTVLMAFLTKYTKDDAVLDRTFFEAFNRIVDAILERIAFEEENLYSDLKNK